MNKIAIIVLLAGGLFLALPAAPAIAGTVWPGSAQWMSEEKTVALLREFWDVQTFDEMQAGHVVITDQMMNELLAGNIAEKSRIERITFASQENGQIKLEVATHAFGRVKIVGVLEEIHHDVTTSSLTFRVLNKHLPDKPFVSWVFSRVSVAMLSKIYGKPVSGTDLSVEIKGNTVTVNFHDYLYTTKVGQVNLFGCRLVDEVQVTGVQTRQGYLLLETSFSFAPKLAAAIPSFLHRS